MRILGVMALLIGALLLVPSEAFAQRGPCPPGTCSTSGTTAANNVKNCKKENCPTGGARVWTLEDCVAKCAQCEASNPNCIQQYCTRYPKRAPGQKSNKIVCQ